MSLWAFSLLLLAAVVSAAIIYYICHYHVIEVLAALVRKLVQTCGGTWLGSLVLAHWSERPEPADVCLIVDRKGDRAWRAILQSVVAFLTLISPSRAQNLGSRDYASELENFVSFECPADKVCTRGFTDLESHFSIFDESE